MDSAVQNGLENDVRVKANTERDGGTEDVADREGTGTQESVAIENINDENSRNNVADTPATAEYSKNIYEESDTMDRTNIPPARDNQISCDKDSAESILNAEDSTTNIQPENGGYTICDNERTAIQIDEREFKSYRDVKERPHVNSVNDKVNSGCDIREQCSTPVNETDLPVKRLKRRKKKRRDIAASHLHESDADGGEPGKALPLSSHLSSSVRPERPHRRRKKRRNPRDGSLDKNIANERTETNDDHVNRTPQISPSCKDDYEKLRSVMKDPRHSRPSSSVINTQPQSLRAKVAISKPDAHVHSNRMAIFSVHNYSSKALNYGIESGAPPVSHEVNFNEKKKKKKKLHGLKKTKATVGVLPTDSGFTGADPERHPAGGKKASGEDGDGEVTSEEKKKEEPVHPEPLKLCKILAGYPISSFRKQF